MRILTATTEPSIVSLYHERNADTCTCRHADRWQTGVLESALAHRHVRSLPLRDVMYVVVADHQASALQRLCHSRSGADPGAADIRHLAVNDGATRRACEHNPVCPVCVHSHPFELQSNHTTCPTRLKIVQLISFQMRSRASLGKSNIDHFSRSKVNRARLLHVKRTLSEDPSVPAIDDAHIGDCDISCSACDIEDTAWLDVTSNLSA